MAFFDDNNDIVAGSGEDPLEALERELDELKRSMSELNDQTQPETPQPEEPWDKPFEESEQTHAQEDEQPTAEYVPAFTPAGGLSPAPKKPKTAIVVIALILAVIGISAGVLYWLMTRPVEEPEPEPEYIPPETVTVIDSVLGEVSIEPVEGASVNTYDADSLVMDDNGFYSYYKDGHKVSEVGVDLCEYQPDVDFEALKEAGIDFVILRVGGRYYSDHGRLYSDSAFADNYENAKAAGLKVGAYFFSQAASVEDAIEEAEYTLELIGERTLDYPIAFDWETIEDDTARTDSVGSELLTEMAKAFCDTVKAAGYRPIVYASVSLMLQSYDFETMKDYEFWLADYREFPEKEKMYYHFTMWQYSTEGSIDGVDGAADLNICFEPY